MSTQATNVRAAAVIRQEFLDFFRGCHGHTYVPSSPVVPHDDPTLLFTNAGMNQFKDVFLGQGERGFTRAVNSQKCIRAGGKHNDLEDVGRDGYHHTFFEMLGNWSFGDYFKAEAIEWAWELLTGVWGLDPDRLYAAVFVGDERDGLEPDVEAEELWKRHLPAARISRWGKKENFWEMGDTGPCGPCSEIHYDGRSAEERAASPGSDLVNRDHPDVIEIWNLVFIQFDRVAGGELRPLPARHVDTGMGLERVVRFIQGVGSNYDTDLWTPLFEAIRERTGARPYGGRDDDAIDVAYRVVADHARCLTAAISDGARPGNEGRGYVLRRILRRAVRHGHQTLETRGAWIHEVVPAVVDTLGGTFPEMREKAAHVAEVIRDEEESFLHTLDRGIALFEEAAGRADARVIGAEDAFKLHDTFGFPIDLTRVMAEEQGLQVDEPGYERLMEAAREQSRGGGASVERLTLPADAIAKLKHLGIKPTRDGDKFAGRPVSSRVKAIWNGTDFDNEAHLGRRVAVLLDRTSFYAESGGQVGDRGRIATDVVDMGTPPGRGYTGTEPRGDGRFEVENAVAFGGYVLHVGHVVEGELCVGDDVECMVDRDHREPVRANHTGTHLLNHALREVVGDDVDQRGSLVAPDRLRFDFTCSHAMAPEAIAETERRVNEAIGHRFVVHAAEVPLAEAMRIHGVRAVFGERYPDPVRVVSIGRPVENLLADPENAEWRSTSIEFCGGTHLAHAGEAKRFVIVQEQALAAGIRRVFAVTGAAAEAADIAGRDLLARADAAERLDDRSLVATYDELAHLVDELTIGAVVRHQVRERLDALRGRIKAVRKSAKSAARRGAVDQAREIATRAAESAAIAIVEAVDDADTETLRSAIDAVRERCPETPVMLFSADESAGKVSIVAAVPKSVIARGLKAGDWIRVAAQACGGGGGGRPDMAQAGGRDPSKVGAAIESARALAEETIS